MEVSAEWDSYGGEEDSTSSGTEEYSTAIEPETDDIGGQHEGLRELTPGDVQESVAVEVGPNDIFTGSPIGVLSMVVPRKREGDHEPVNISGLSAELQSPEGLERFRNSHFVSATEAAYEGQAQSATVDQGSISPYSFGEVTQSSSTAAPLETRFMHVWNLFDTERKGEVPAQYVPAILEKYREICWDSKNPLMDEVTKQYTTRYTTDPQYSQLFTNTEEVQKLARTLAAQARFQEVMKSFDYNDNLRIRVKDIPRLLNIFEGLVKQNFITYASKELVEFNSKDPELQETYISHQDVKDLMKALIGQPIIDFLASNITYDDEPYIQNEVVEKTRLEALEQAYSQKQESIGGSITPKVPAAAEVLIPPQRLLAGQKPFVGTPITRTQRHSNSGQDPENSLFSLNSPLAQSTPFKAEPEEQQSISAADEALISPRRLPAGGTSFVGIPETPFGNVRKARPPWHSRSFGDPEKSPFSLGSPVAQSTPFGARTGSALWSPESHLSFGNLTDPFLSPLFENSRSISTGYRDPVAEDLVRTQRERDDLRGKIEELENELEGSKAENLYLQKEVSHAREYHSWEELENLQWELENTKKEVERLRSKLAKKETEVERNYSQLLENCKDYEELQQKHVNTQGANARCRKEKKKAVEEFLQLNKLYNELQDKANQMEHDAYANAHQLKMAKKVNEALQVGLKKEEEHSRALEVIIEQYTQTIDMLKLQTQDLTRENAFFEGTYSGKDRRPRRKSKESQSQVELEGEGNGAQQEDFEVKIAEMKEKLQRAQEEIERGNIAREQQNEKLDKEQKRLIKAIADKQGLKRQLTEFENLNKNICEEKERSQALVEKNNLLRGELKVVSEVHKKQVLINDTMKQEHARVKLELLEALNQGRRQQETITQQQATIRNYEMALTHNSHNGTQRVNLAQITNIEIVRALRELKPEELNRLNPQLWPATPYENMSVAEFSIWPILEIMRHLINASKVLRGIYRNRVKEYNDMASSPPQMSASPATSPPLPSPQGPGTHDSISQTPSTQTRQVNRILQKAVDILSYAECLFLAAVDPEKRCTSPNAFHRAILWLLIFMSLLGTLVYQCILVAKVEAEKLMWAEANGPMVRSWLAGRRGGCEHSGSPAGGILGFGFNGGAASMDCVDIRYEDPILLQLFRHWMSQYFKIDRELPA